MLLSYHNCPGNATGRQPENLRRTATTGLTMGTTTLQDAVAKAVHRLAETGITGFIDKGGHQWTPEAYVSMDLRTTLHNTYIQGQQARSAEFGISTFRISSHPASRPLCAPYQGWICSWDNVSGVVHDLYGNAYVVHPISETSYGEPAGIFGINCGHEPETFIDGISVPRSAPLTGAELEQDNEAYLLTQKQRALERRVRQYRTEAVALHAAGQPIPPELALKVKSAQSRLSEFCKTNGLTERLAGTQVMGYNRSVGSAVGKAARSYNPADVSALKAVSGARITDMYSPRAEAHAERYYGLVRKMRTDVAAISRNTGIDEETIQAIKDFIFMEKHDLGEEGIKHFAPDFAMAQSWRRLIEGKYEPHDMTLLQHEIMERQLMGQGLSQGEAHRVTSKDFNYQKETTEYYDNLKANRNK